MEGRVGPFRDTAYKTKKRAVSGSGLHLLKLIQDIIDGGNNRLIDEVTLEVEKCLKRMKE